MTLAYQSNANMIILLSHSIITMRKGKTEVHLAMRYCDAFLKVVRKMPL